MGAALSYSSATPVHYSASGISFCNAGTFAAAQSTKLFPLSPNIAAVACPGSSVKFALSPRDDSTCVAASGCASQYENAAAFTKNRIVRFIAFVLSHSTRVFVPDSDDCAERLARFNTCNPCPVKNNPQ